MIWWVIFFTIFRLELNLSSLESENQVLRQQALVAADNESLSEELQTYVLTIQLNLFLEILLHVYA